MTTQRAERAVGTEGGQHFYEFDYVFQATT